MSHKHSSSSSSASTMHGSMGSSSSAAPAAKRVKLDVHDNPTNAPLLVSFPGGVPAFSLDDMEVYASRLSSTKLSAPKTKLRVSLDQLVYESNDFGENSAKKDCYTFAIGVIKARDDSKMHIYPAGHPYTLRTKPKEFASRVNEMTNAARKESLTQEFGSKKKKSQVRAAKSNLISAENISGAKDLKVALTDNAPEVDVELLQTAEDVVKRGRIRQSRSGKK